MILQFEFWKGCCVSMECRVGLPKACQVLLVPSSCQSSAVIQTQASKFKGTTGQPNLELHYWWYIAVGKGGNHPLLVCLYLSRHVKVLPALWSSVAWRGPELSHAVYWVSQLGMMTLRLKETNYELSVFVLIKKKYCGNTLGEWCVFFAGYVNMLV